MTILEEKMDILKQFKGRNKLVLLVDFLVDTVCADAT